LSILNSKLFFFAVKNFYGGGGLGSTGIRMKHTFFENCPAPIAKDTKPFETLADYLIYLNDESKPPVNPHTSNASITPVFEDVLNMMVYELYFEQHMKEEEIDVLKFVDFESIEKVKSDKAKADIINSVFKELQEQKNQIRNRIILSNIRSKNIIARINETTH
jgi:hypothetical protein